MFNYWFCLFILFFSWQARASHAMGGEITYKCVGNNKFVFELIFYRDCNGAEVNTTSENLRVWNHPTLTSINVPFISREDISPRCSPVTNSPPMLSCGAGSAGGNGVGAIERITYRSLPITLSGTPPAQGWIFTYENFSRSSALTNIQNPSLYGITLAAKMYAIPNAAPGSCLDSSPIFLQEPYFVSCATTPYRYNMNAIDPDLDSLHFDFGVPFDHFPSGNYNPPTNPQPVPFETGFTFSSPTPGTSLNPSNVPANIDPLTGELTFKSYNVGNYVVKVSVKSYRRGILISEVEREMQLVVTACNAANTTPTIAAPFTGNSFETTVVAGDPIHFDLVVTDNELLQDGSPQSVYLTASGPMFGTNFTLSTGCDIEPCAFLNATTPLTGTQGVTASFDWQTTCSHLVNQYGIVGDVVPYHFVFKVQDNYCQVPKVSYATVTINVINPGVIPATQINCIQTGANGDISISWTPVSDPNGTFVGYELYSIQDGLLANFNNINASTYTMTGVTSAKDIFIGVRSGCNGNTLRNSDTLRNIFLNVTNPLNGTAVVQWNKPNSNQLPGFNNYYYLYREYPAGTYTLYDSIPYGTTIYKDTIDICHTYLNYKIVLKTSACDFTSNIDGDDFHDMLTPNIPSISGVGADTSNNQILLTWNVNHQPDTYGYVIYTFDENGFLFELDTVWGRNNTSYEYPVDWSNGPFSYSVAAFDSCYTSSTPVTFQTSAKSNIHKSMTLTSQVLMCEKQVVVNWTAYSGRSVAQYEIWGKSNGNWELLGTSNSITDTVDVNSGTNYCLYVKAVFPNNQFAFSEPNCVTIPVPQSPAYHYFKLATVENQKVKLFDYIESSVGISEIIYYRKNQTDAFEEIGRTSVTNDVTLFVDTNVDLRWKPWEYKTAFTDSCGGMGTYANTNKTIFVSGTTDEYYLINTIEWTAYEGFDGAIINYDIFRGVNGIFDPTPIATVPGNEFKYVDNVSLIPSDGKICYHVEAVEALNSYNFAERSRSNDFCFIYTPLVFVPNAFTPSGENPIFKPVLSNVAFDNYTFTVLSRWGQVIFQTHDTTEGWDGTIKGSTGYATSDVFEYILEYRDQDKNPYVKRGCVALLR